MPTSKPNRAAGAVVLEALKGQKTLAQLSSQFGIHAQMITTGLAHQWKRQALEGLPSLFETAPSKSTTP
jgi:transposase-like protein